MTDSVQNIEENLKNLVKARIGSFAVPQKILVCLYLSNTDQLCAVTLIQTACVCGAKGSRHFLRGGGGVWGMLP